MYILSYDRDVADSELLGGASIINSLKCLKNRKLLEGWKDTIDLWSQIIGGAAAHPAHPVATCLTI